MGLALSGAFRWGPRHRRTRALFLPLGLNLAALALLAAILVAGSEPGGLLAHWAQWVIPFGVTSALGLLGFRFPRAAGIPLLLLALFGFWTFSEALKGFSAAGPHPPSVRVQPLTDKELRTAFALQVDYLDVPPTVPFLPRDLYRLRPGESSPEDWWWSWATDRGWARSLPVQPPTDPLKFGVYRLGLADHSPQWRLEKPDLSEPGR